MFLKEEGETRGSCISTLWDTVGRLQSASQEEGLDWGVELSSTLISDFLASRTSRNEGLLFNPPSLWYFVMAAQID